MIQTAEQLLETVRTLSVKEQEKFFDLLEAEKRHLAEKETKNLELKARDEKFKRALKWIEEHKEEYDGKFVVLDGDTLVSIGEDSKTVYDEARAKGYESPFLKRIKAKTLPFGGW